MSGRNKAKKIELQYFQETKEANMEWLEQLPKKERHGSRPRCLLLMDGRKEEVADRLTRLVGHPDAVVITGSDIWKPFGKPVQRENGVWDSTPAGEAELHKHLLLPAVRERLRAWWLVVNGRATTPRWDIASTCIFKDIRGGPKKGLLLIEAKAHGNELDSSGKRCDSRTNLKNHARIEKAILEAASGLQSVTGRPWKLSRDDHYQLSNRFAWSWKLATLGIPVVLLYLGFLDAEDMADDGPLFRSEREWEHVLKNHCRSYVDEVFWGKRIDVHGVPLLPLIRVDDQPFPPWED